MFNSDFVSLPFYNLNWDKSKIDNILLWPRVTSDSLGGQSTKYRTLRLKRLTEFQIIYLGRWSTKYHVLSQPVYIKNRVMPKLPFWFWKSADSVNIECLRTWSDFVKSADFQTHDGTFSTTLFFTNTVLKLDFDTCQYTSGIQCNHRRSFSNRWQWSR